MFLFRIENAHPWHGEPPVLSKKRVISRIMTLFRRQRHSSSPRIYPSDGYCRGGLRTFVQKHPKLDIEILGATPRILDSEEFKPVRVDDYYM